MALKSDINNGNKKNNNDLYNKRSKIEKIKTLIKVSENRNKKRALIIRNSNLINNTTYKTNKGLKNTENILNKYILPHSLSISIENYNDRYHSPTKPIQEEKNLSVFQNFSNIGKIRLEKFNSSKHFNNIVAKKIDFTPSDNNKNKKSQMINEYKSNAIGVKKSENMSIRNIPISPRGKNMNKKNNTNVNSNNKNENINNTLSNIKSNEEGDKIKRIHSYTTSKLQENQYHYGQLQIRKNLNKKSFIKGINIIDNNKFKDNNSILYSNENKNTLNLNNKNTSKKIIN